MKFANVVVILLFALSLPSLAVEKVPTIVLVHGAFFTSAVWSRTQRALQDKGYNVVTLSLAGRDGDTTGPDKINLQLAAAKVCKIAQLQDGPVLLLGHSLGGAVIKQATDQCSKDLKALVFLAAVAPSEGVPAFPAQIEETGFGNCAKFDPVTQTFMIKSGPACAASFFGDIIDSDQQNKLVAQMVSEPKGIGTSQLEFKQLSADQFFRFPKYYIHTTQDQLVPYKDQVELAKNLGVVETYSMNTSHCPFFSQPDQLASIIIQIVRSL